MQITEELILWYTLNKRNLPWREINDPYKIWVSEIILQQTRIKQGLPYYQKFIERFPSIEILEKAEINDILSIWQGLGYYSRARNMHVAAKQIIAEYSGFFPNKYNDIIKLKGVGKYTAAAIASFAFKQYKPVIDGNVIRIITRIYGLYENSKSVQTLKKIEKILNENIIKTESPDTFNQAIMEFGQKVCLPANPSCNNCIFKKSCNALNENKVLETPKIFQKKEKKERYFNYLIVLNNGYTFIKKRQKKDIWEELYEFPLLEQKNVTKEILLNHFGLINYLLSNVHKSKITKHTLSHQNINTIFWTLSVTSENELIYLKKHYLMVEFKKISEYPFSILITKYIAQITIED